MFAQPLGLIKVLWANSTRRLITAGIGLSLAALFVALASVAHSQQTRAAQDQGRGPDGRIPRVPRPGCVERSDGREAGVDVRLPAGFRSCGPAGRQQRDMG